MRFINGHGGVAALVSIVSACAHAQGTAVSTAPVARPVAAAALLLVGADGALTLDARRVSEADLDRALRMDALYSPGRAVTIAGAADASYGGVLRALELAAFAAAGPITLAAPDLHPLTAFPRPTGEAGARYVRVTIDGDGRVWLDQALIGCDDLATRARALLAERRQWTIVVAADRRALYGRVSASIDALRGAGFTDFLITTAAAVASAPEAGDGAPAVASAPASVPPPAQQGAVQIANLPRIECDENVLRRFFPRAFAERGTSNARVRLRLSVGENGAITGAQAVEDPGFGLGSAAERAVMTGCRSTVPRDRAGRPVATVMVFRMNFEFEGPSGAPTPAL